jgi:hypothetical protein
VVGSINKPQMPSAFEFLIKRPFDILINAKPSGERHRVRKLQIYYAEKGSYYSFEYNLMDAAYGNDRTKLIRAAAKALLNEVKSRALSNQDFTVWFYDKAGRDLIESEAGQIAREEPVWQRYLDRLVVVNRTLDEGEKITRDPNARSTESKEKNDEHD